MNFKNSLFTNGVRVPESCKIIFVSDMFVEDYVGGAELTSEALIDSSPYEVYKLHSKDVSLELLKQHQNKYWIFGNATQMTPSFVPTIISNMKYSALEYDYKYCRARSPEKHFVFAKQECDCANQPIGQMIATFFQHSGETFWMSEGQKNHYLNLFSQLRDKTNIVLSSVFSKESLSFMRELREKYKTTERKKWLVLGSESWIKGADEAQLWCAATGKDYEVVWNVPYKQLLERMAQAEGFVYLPKGKDTCPRMVIEAKLLGCQLYLNDNVQHKDEDWFNSPLEEIEEYLFAAHSVFWNAIKTHMDYKPSVSGYTTTYNCVSQQYPFEQSIRSLLQFCDEVCVVDGGSTDGTLEVLEKLSAEDVRLKYKVISRDWNDPKSAVFDGLQKAEARLMCTKEYCWQMDSDEIFHETDVEKVRIICRSLSKEVDVIALPVVEYWGSYDKVRVDVNPWKWRLSRNRPHITHGIPVELRKYDEEGNLYASEGTDGCDMIDSSTGQRLPFLSFYTGAVDGTRMAALSGDMKANQAYENWFNSAITELPAVYHYSWFNMVRKIHTYKNFWTRHWITLLGKDYVDSAETNMMFDVPWSEVTDEMIEQRAKELSTNTGGWIWHRKFDGTRRPHIKCHKSPPAVMKEWK